MWRTLSRPRSRVGLQARLPSRVRRGKALTRRGPRRPLAAPTLIPPVPGDQHRGLGVAEKLSPHVAEQEPEEATTGRRQDERLAKRLERQLFAVTPTTFEDGARGSFAVVRLRARIYERPNEVRKATVVERSKGRPPVEDLGRRLSEHGRRGRRSAPWAASGWRSS